MKSNLGQFLSLFLLSMIAVMLYAVFESSNIGADQALDEFHAASNLADGWLYGESFSEEDFQKIQKLDHIEDAQLRLQLDGTSIGQNMAQVDVYLENENLVSRPYVTEGLEFDPKDQDSISDVCQYRCQ